MVELYTAKGMTREDASVCIKALARYPELFVDVMMSEELGLVQPGSSSWLVALAAVGGFALWGMGSAIGFAAVIQRHAEPGPAFAHALASVSAILTEELAAVLRVGPTKVGFPSVAWWTHLGAAADPLAGLIAVAILMLGTHGLVHALLLPSATRNSRWQITAALPVTGAMLLLVAFVCVIEHFITAATGVSTPSQ